MKKLMIAAAIVCAATLAQASAFKWTISGMNKVYESGSTTTWSGTAYLFDAKTYSQAMLLDSGYLDTSKAIASSAVSAGILSGNTPTANAKEFNFGADGDNNQFYMALIDGDNIYVSANVNSAGQQGKTTAVTVSAANSKLAATEWTTGDTFSKAGWYTAAAVPEPTSGLLLLLGVAGIALKRRRA